MTIITAAAAAAAMLDAYGAALARRSADDAYGVAYRGSMTTIARAIAGGTSANSIAQAAKSRAKDLTAAQKKSDDYRENVFTSSAGMGYALRIGQFLLLPGADDLSPFAASGAIRFLCNEASATGLVSTILAEQDQTADKALTALRREEQKARQAANEKKAAEKAAEKALKEKKEDSDDSGEVVGETLLLSQEETAAGLLRAATQTIGRAVGMTWDEAATDAATALLTMLQDALADSAARSEAAATV